MKIIATLKLQNEVMVMRRKELGLTQKELGELVGVHMSTIAEIELLRNPGIHSNRIDMVLADVADALDVPFKEIFPQDYLKAVYGKRLLDRSPNRVSVERDIGELLEGGNAPMLERDIDRKLLTEVIDEVLLETLPERERDIIQRHFGIGRNKMTSEEIGNIYKLRISGVRVQQYEAMALSRLRGKRSILKLEGHRW